MDTMHADLELAVAEQCDVPDMKDGIHLMTAFRQIPSSAIRKSFIAFVESLASELTDESSSRDAPIGRLAEG